MPTFGAVGNAPCFAEFRDSIVFPLDLGSLGPGLARLGHGSRGWREDGGYLLGVYRLHQDTLEPVAGFSVVTNRTRLSSVITQ